MARTLRSDLTDERGVFLEVFIAPKPNFFFLKQVEPWLDEEFSLAPWAKLFSKVRCANSDLCLPLFEKAMVCPCKAGTLWNGLSHVVN